MGGVEIAKIDSHFILVGCAQTAAVGDPMEVVGLLFFCALKFVRLLIQV